ncbi:hypothetical protein pb186bvf_008999 [Paramecium bursaria]
MKTNPNEYLLQPKTFNIGYSSRNVTSRKNNQVQTQGGFFLSDRIQVAIQTEDDNPQFPKQQKIIHNQHVRSPFKHHLNYRIRVQPTFRVNSREDRDKMPNFKELESKLQSILRMSKLRKKNPESEATSRKISMKHNRYTSVTNLQTPRKKQIISYKKNDLAEHSFLDETLNVNY